MHAYFIRNLSELAQRRAIILRDEAQLWDILSRDLKREASRAEEVHVPKRRDTPALEQARNAMETQDNGKLFVRVSEATEMMGISRSSLYVEIASSRLKVRKSGRKTLIAVSDIQAWFDSLSERSGKR